MDEMNDALSKLRDSFNHISNISFPTIPDYSNIITKIAPVEIDPESTFPYQIRQQTEQIIEKSNEQIKLLNEQNEKLVSSLKKLEDLCELKEKELEEARKDAKKSKGYNAVMMIITIISMLVAIAAWLVPNILGGGS